jgi:hypothetical protein
LLKYSRSDLKAIGIVHRTGVVPIRLDLDLRARINLHARLNLGPRELDSPGSYRLSVSLEPDSSFPSSAKEGKSSAGERYKWTSPGVESSESSELVGGYYTRLGSGFIKIVSFGLNRRAWTDYRISILNQRPETDYRVSYFKSEDCRLLEGGTGSCTLINIKGASFALVKG